MDALPFINPTGLEYPSLLRVEDSGIAAEFRKRAWRRRARNIGQVRIPIEEIASVRVRSSAWLLHVDLQLRSMQSAADIPCRKPSLIEMRFVKEHREAARAMVAQSQMAVSEHRLDRLGREMGPLEH